MRWPACERLDRRQEPVMHRPEECWRGNRIPTVIVEEVAHATGRLERGHVGVQVEPVDTADRERHVLADNVGDVGRHRTLLGGKVDDGTPQGRRRWWTSVHHFPVKLRLKPITTRFDTMPLVGLRRSFTGSLDPKKYDCLSQVFQAASLTSSRKSASAASRRSKARCARADPDGCRELAGRSARV